MPSDSDLDFLKGDAAMKAGFFILFGKARYLLCIKSSNVAADSCFRYAGTCMRCERQIGG